MNILAGVGGILLKVRLTVNAPVLGPGSRRLDFTDPTYAGYAPFNSSSWTPPTVQPNDDVAITSPIIQFPGPTSGVGQLIYGYIVTFEQSPGNLLWRAVQWAVPKPMILPTDLIAFQITLALRNLLA